MWTEKELTVEALRAENGTLLFPKEHVLLPFELAALFQGSKEAC